MTRNVRKTLVSVFIILLGIMLAVAGMATSSLDGGKKEKQICSIYANYKTIKINSLSDDVIIKAADEAGPRVMAYEQDGVRISVRSETSGELIVEKIDSRQWFDKISFGEANVPIVIYLSKSVTVNLEITTDSGNVTIESGVKCENVSVTSKSGDITLLSSVTGDVKLLTAGNIARQ